MSSALTWPVSMRPAPYSVRMRASLASSCSKKLSHFTGTSTSRLAPGHGLHGVRGYSAFQRAMLIGTEDQEIACALASVFDEQPYVQGG